MSAKMCFEMMEDYVPSLAATKKYGKIPENFAWYEFGWVGDFKTTDTMKVTGAQFRVAKTGKNKGEPSIVLKETKIEVYINNKDMKAAEKALEKKQAKAKAQAISEPQAQAA